MTPKQKKSVEELRNRPTVKTLVYKGYMVEVKETGECYTKSPRDGHVIWGEDEEAIRINIKRNIRCIRLYEKWDKEDKQSA